MFKRSFKFTAYILILIILTSFYSTPVYADTCPTLGSAGRISTAATFDGTSYLKLAYNAANPIFQITGSKSFSISVWIKPSESLDGYKGIIGDDYNYNWLLSGGDNTNSIGFYVNGTRTTTSANSIPLNSWTHVVATFNGTTKSIYINGSLVAQDAVSSINMSGNGDILVGSNIYGAAYKGSMDDVRIYSKALSSAEVSSLYSGTNVSSSLSGYWTLNDAAGSTSIADTSGNNASSSCAPVLGSICQYATNNVYGSWYLTGPDGSVYSITDANVNCCMDIPGTWTLWGVQNVNGYGTPTISPSASQTLIGGGSISWTIDYPIGSSAPSIPTISGPTSGVVNTNYSYTFTSTDPSSKQIRYGVDWTNPFDGVADEWLPTGGSSTITTTWSKVSGPGTVTFANSATTTTTATFSASGSYTLRLTGSDGTSTSTDDAVVTVNPSSVALWKMDETAGATTFSDSSGNSINASCYGSCPTSGATGKLGNSIGLNGSTQALQLPYNSSNSLYQIKNSTPFSVSVWIKPTVSIDGWRGIVGGDYTANWLLSGGDNSNSIGFYIQGTRLSTPSNTVPLNTWTHVVVTYDGTTKSIYLNGSLSVQGSASGASMSNPGSNILIGANPYGSYFGGYIDDLRVFDKSLSASEIQNLATGIEGTSGSSSGSTVSAGLDQTISLPSTASLAGTVSFNASSATYVNSGVSKTASHSWSSTGTKQFKVLSQNADGVNSDWSSAYSVIISSSAQNAVCGAKAGGPSASNRNYNGETDWYVGDTECSVGTASSQTFPTAGNSVTWTCTGVNGGTSASCTAVNTTGGSTKTLNVTTTKGGKVTSQPAGLNCGSTCSYNFSTNSSVKLIPVPDTVYWKFSGWSGACSGTGSCTVNMSADKTVNATFAPRSIRATEI